MTHESGHLKWAPDEAEPLCGLPSEIADPMAEYGIRYTPQPLIASAALSVKRQQEYPLRRIGGDPNLKGLVQDLLMTGSQYVPALIVCNINSSLLKLQGQRRPGDARIV